jgi:hypothetical protein
VVEVLTGVDQATETEGGQFDGVSAGVSLEHGSRLPGARGDTRRHRVGMSGC